MVVDLAMADYLMQTNRQAGMQIGRQVVDR
jgi:hypothetical protein